MWRVVVVTKSQKPISTLNAVNDGHQFNSEDRSITGTLNLCDIDILYRQHIHIFLSFRESWLSVTMVQLMAAVRFKEQLPISGKWPLTRLLLLVTGILLISYMSSTLYLMRVMYRCTMTIGNHLGRYDASTQSYDGLIGMLQRDVSVQTYTESTYSMILYDVNYRKLIG